MIHYFLELEESIGKVWDRFLYKKVTKLHTNHSVSLSDISTTLTLFYHLLGGKKGKSIQATDKRTINTKRTRLEKISFMGKEFYLSWQDEKSLYLPPSLAFFPKKEDNEMLYYWLVAMLSQADVNEIDIIKQNIKLSEELKNNYDGF